EGQSNAVRMQRVVGSYAEKLAVLELQTAVPNARSVAILMLPLMPEDRVMTLAYPNDRLHTVVGRFVQYADTGRLAGTALLEIFEGENRLVIDYGASGAPVSALEICGSLFALESRKVGHYSRSSSGRPMRCN